MPCFTRGVFRVPKNEMRKTNKPPARQVVEMIKTIDIDLLIREEETISADDLEKEL